MTRFVWVSLFAVGAGCGTSSRSARTADAADSASVANVDSDVAPSDLPKPMDSTEEDTEATDGMAPDSGPAPKCTPYEKSCDGPDLVICTPDGQSTTLVESCAAGLGCDPVELTCICQPACTGKQCGADGCGGSCGTCPTGTTCGVDGACAEKPPPPPPPPCPDKSCCTCSPGKSCEAGIDNMLSGLSGLTNSALQKAVDDGDVNWEFEFAPDLGSGGVLNLYTSSPDAALVSPGDFDASCQPKVRFAVSMDGVALTATQIGEPVTLLVPLAGITLTVPIRSARIEGQATAAGVTAILGGGVVKEEFMNAVDAIPPDKLPISKDALKSILSNVVKNDLDLLDASGNAGQDGVLDSASIALKFEAKPSTIKGVQSPNDGPCSSLPTTFSKAAFRATTLGIGEDAKIGNGLDIDGICTPAP